MTNEEIRAWCLLSDWYQCVNITCTHFQRGRPKDTKGTRGQGGGMCTCCAKNNRLVTMEPYLYECDGTPAQPGKLND